MATFHNQKLWMEVKMVIKSNSAIIVGCCAIIISETNTLCEIIVCFYLPYVTAFNSFFPYPIIIQGQRAFNTFLCNLDEVKCEE